MTSLRGWHNSAGILRQEMNPYQLLSKLAFSKGRKMSCTIGKILSEECDLEVYTKFKGTKSFSVLQAEEKEILKLRVGVDIGSDGDVCFHHEQVYLVKYSHLYQKKCCDPFLVHGKKGSKSSLREITLTTAKQFSSIGETVIPGQKLCPKCRIRLNDKLKCVDDKRDSDIEDNYIPDNEAQMEDMRVNLDKSLESMDVSPLKLHSVATHSKISHGKRKFDQVKKKLEKEESTIKQQVAMVMSIPSDKLDDKESQPDNFKELTTKARDLDELLFLMKEKLQISNRDRKIQILTMVPPSWSLKQTQEFFKVSQYMAKKAKKLAVEKGIMELPDKKMGKSFSKETENLVLEFFCDDEFSRQMPGKKDFVSVRRNFHVQKRLLLCNLRELYTEFKGRYPDKKIGFSKFCSLRPKWCILVGSFGTHSVCVCAIHQNVKLMLNAVDLNNSYHDLIEQIVCDKNSKDCMVHRCPDCPGVNNLKEFLKERLLTDDSDDDDGDSVEGNITFSQWTTVDRSELIIQNLPTEDFIFLLASKIDALTAHSYIAKAQAQHLKKCKEELQQDDCIILLDFAENLKFVIQDEIQSYHWHQQTCSLHPVVIYYKRNNILCDKSLCIVSDDLDHDTSFVYKVMSVTISFLKEKLNPEMKLVHYFSDGCSGQYKNYKNFLNVCLHHHDFSVSCTWSFFATSHGKSPCDGIGGTIKRLVTRASLQRPQEGQILTARQVHEFCVKEIKGVASIFVCKEEIELLRCKLDKRYQKASTLPGTRSFHHFVPLTETVIGAKRVSSENDYTIKYDIVGGLEIDKVGENLLVKCSDFIICRYDQHFWLGFTISVDEIYDDVEVKFMHPAFPSMSFTWPQKEDICFVPKPHILYIVKAPITTTGRSYKLHRSDVVKVHDEIKKQETISKLLI